MREIKFRAWDEEKREMFEVSGMRWKDGMVTGDDTWYGDDFLSPAERVSSTLMQYTGLKDKNGVEIYEGDILKDSRKDFYGGNTERIDVVYYNTDPVGFTFGEDWDPLNTVDIQRMEVIGNAYEHLNLLQDNE